MILLNPIANYLESFRPSMNELMIGATWSTSDPQVLKSCRFIPSVKENIADNRWGLIAMGGALGASLIISQIALAFFTGPLLTITLVAAIAVGFFAAFIPIPMLTTEPSFVRRVSISNQMFYILGAEKIKTLPWVRIGEHTHNQVGFALCYSALEYPWVSYQFQYKISGQEQPVIERLIKKECDWTYESSMGDDSQIGIKAQLNAFTSNPAFDPVDTRIRMLLDGKTVISLTGDGSSTVQLYYSQGGVI